MGSIQQVAMAAVCLVAAFAFGSFINQTPTDGTTQTNAASPDNLRSLIEPEVPVQTIPGSTPLMKPKLTARLPMPSLTNNNYLPSQAIGGEIPPPSDLTGRIKPTQNSLANSFSTEPDPTGLVADAPTFAPDLSGESAMPVVNQPTFGNSPNLADSMRAPFRTNDSSRHMPAAENAPVFVAGEFTAQASPANQSNQKPNQSFSAPAIGKAPAFPNLNQQSQPFVAAKPALPDRRLAPLPESVRSTPQKTVISQSESSHQVATRDQFRYSNPQRFNTNDRSQNNLMPVPSINQPVTIDDPGGAFGNRDSRASDSQSGPQLAWSNPRSVLSTNDTAYYPKQTQRQPQQSQQRRAARLPLQLNSNAQSKLTQLRDNTIQKISLSTTQFSEYVVEPGDSLQSIAKQMFGKPDYYLDIYLANRDRLRFPGDLREGMSIKIPVYQQ